MTSLFKAAEIEAKQSPVSYTENGALTYSSTGSAVLDLFSRGAAMRKASDKEITELFRKAFEENVALAVAVLFYIRDVRGGQGERRFFRTAIKWLSSKCPELVAELLPFIPEYGRWDDLFVLQDTELGSGAFRLVAMQLLKDASAVARNDVNNLSLAAKWAPSESSGKASRKRAIALMQSMGVSPRQYRKLLSSLRKHLDIVERKMCAKQFELINYQTVPSRASMLYKDAFQKWDGARYLDFLASVKKGEAKINSSVLYPYELVSKVIQEGKEDLTYQLQWDSLVDYVSDKKRNAIVVVDGSGSMYSYGYGSVIQSSTISTPIHIAVSIGLYFAERNTGIFKDKLITFSETPAFIDLSKVKGFYNRVKHIKKYNEVANTNLQAVFDLILGLAKKYEVPQEELPDTVYIVSDMEFDSCVVGTNGMVTSQNDINLRAIDKKYLDSGYKRPNIVFWNVAARNQHSPATYDDKGIALVSGCSPSIFKTAMDGPTDPITAMLATVNSERYEPIISKVMSFKS